jgi:hypothetical protein
MSVNIEGDLPEGDHKSEYDFHISQKGISNPFPLERWDFWV